MEEMEKKENESNLIDSINLVLINKINEIKEKNEELLKIEEEKKREIINKRNKNNKSNQINDRDWIQSEINLLAKAVKKFPPGLGKRWQVIADYVNHQSRTTNLVTKGHCIKKYQEIQANPNILHQNDNNDNNNNNEEKENKTTNNNTNDSDIWTPEQQKQLEEGLAKYPSSMEKGERWRNIASNVEGKNRKQCITRFKYLRKQVLKNKKLNKK